MPRSDEHPYRDCRDPFCDRYPCKVYKEGVRDGYAGGYATGYGDGQVDGYVEGYNDAAAATADA